MTKSKMETLDIDQNKEINENSECSSNDDISVEEVNSDESEITKKVYLPGEKIEVGEELVVDESAYRFLHQANSGAPCLSFDIIQDNLGNFRESFPMTMYIVAGTQASRTHLNNLLVMKLSNLQGVNSKSDSHDEFNESEDESEVQVPEMTVALIKHQGCVNRIRSVKIGNITLAASWNELGKVSIWNLDEQLKTLENPKLLSAYKKKYQKAERETKPIFSFKGHINEGYSLDWCSTDIGTLASGDCKGNIHIWKYDQGKHIWHVNQKPYSSHAPKSVEDLQWSPSERNVLASCSVDKSIKIWDIRANIHSACMLSAINAHSSDVNVISWNKKETQFLLSGGDDGVIRVWDLRQFNKNNASPIASFKQHTAPVTTVEWHPHEATIFASGGSDDQITQWDLSVEDEKSEEIKNKNVAQLPPQLLFIHQGQNDIKELHWHPQCTGTIISTAHSGFNIFRTISV